MNIVEIKKGICNFPKGKISYTEITPDNGMYNEIMKIIYPYDIDKLHILHGNRINSYYATISINGVDHIVRLSDHFKKLNKSYYLLNNKSKVSKVKRNNTLKFRNMYLGVAVI